MKPHRRQPLYLAVLLHRFSGLALALFLPLHFFVLGLALTGEAALDSALAWTEGSLFKFAEFGLVFLLAVHLFGGLRLLALEFLPWRDWQKNMAATACAVAFFIAVGFLLSAI
jgi:fumarate reductase subunit D